MSDSTINLYRLFTGLIEVDEENPAEGADEELDRLERQILANPLSADPETRGRELGIVATISLKRIEWAAHDDRLNTLECDQLLPVIDALKVLADFAPARLGATSSGPAN